MNKEEKSFAEKFAILKKKGKALVLSGIVMVCLGLSIVLSAIPFVAVQDKAQKELTDEVELIMTSEEYAKHTTQVTEQLKKQYQNGEISAKEYAKQVRNLTNREYILENFENEKIKEINQQKNKVENTALAIIAPGGVTAFAGVGLWASGIHRNSQALNMNFDEEELESE